ncbi:MAG: RICIN domain-containing protein [Oscillospiraceae bacterium]|jgi:hypothetical protein|nr:RICIN domain-containing protein [Oscillospiraceae bacterium]
MEALWCIHIQTRGGVQNEDHEEQRTKNGKIYPPCDNSRHKGHTRLRVTLSLMLVLALVFGCVGAFAGEALALGASANGNTGGDNGYVYIRNVKTGMYLTFPDTTVNTSSFLQVRTYYGTLANSARQQWRPHHGTKADGSSYVVFHSKLNDNYVISAGDGGHGTYLRLSAYNSTSTAAQRFDIIHGSGVARIVSHVSINSGTPRSVQVQDGGTTTNIASGTPVNQRTPYSTPDTKAHQYWVFEDVGERWMSLMQIKVLGVTVYLNAVDSGNHCDWEFNQHGSQQEYDPLITKATAAWNAKIGGSAVFRKKSGLVDVDLSFGESNVPHEDDTELIKINAETKISLLGTATIKLFKPTMATYLPSELQKLHTITHELGHVLGINEINAGADSKGRPISRGNIMSQGNLSYGSSFALDDKDALASARTYW